MNDSGAEKKYPITVSVDTSVPYTLKVSIPDLSVEPEDGGQLIEWQLDEALSKGGAEFVDLTACKPGFEWLSAPPPAAAIFGKAVRPKKDTLEIRDTHKAGSNSKGTWLYKLRVTYEGHTYETPMAIDLLPAGETRTYMLVGSNPIIINR